MFRSRSVNWCVPVIVVAWDAEMIASSLSFCRFKPLRRTRPTALVSIAFNIVMILTCGRKKITNAIY